MKQLKTNLIVKIKIDRWSKWMNKSVVSLDNYVKWINLFIIDFLLICIFFNKQYIIIINAFVNGNTRV